MNDIERLRDDIIKLKQYLAYRANCKQKSSQNAYDKAIKSIIAELDETCLEPLSEYRITKTEITRRTRVAMDKLKDSGKQFTSVMFGWDNVKDGTVVPNWDEQDLIDYMRHLYMKDDRSAAWIARKMNKDNNIISTVGTVGLPACYGGFETLVENLLSDSDDGITVFTGKISILSGGPFWFSSVFNNFVISPYFF